MKMSKIKSLRKIVSAIVSILSYGVFPVLLIQQLEKGLTIQDTLVRVIVPANIIGLIAMSIIIAILSLIEIKDRIIDGAILSTRYFIIMVYEICWFLWISNLIIYANGSSVNLGINLSAYGGLILLGTLLTWIFKYIGKVTEKPKQKTKS